MARHRHAGRDVSEGAARGLIDAKKRNAAESEALTLG